jgi:hypothetical protein
MVGLLRQSVFERLAGIRVCSTFNRSGLVVNLPSRRRVGPFIGNSARKGGRMTEIRDKARKILDLALPVGKVITSDGATAAQYTRLTGLTHKMLTDNWAKGGIMTGCNGFTGWYGSQMGSKKYLGGFDLKRIVTDAGKPDSWIESTPDNRPMYGDILRHSAFHVDVALDFDGDILLRAAGGQGGKKAGHDIVRRVRGASKYDPKSLMGWINIDLYLGEFDDEI